jgi:hypothetical protein
VQLEYAKNPRWSNRSQTKIDLIVRFTEINEELPFTANVSDPEPHGRDIFARAQAGEFGEVAPFNPVPPTLEEVAAIFRETRNYKLQNEVDPIVSNPLRWADLSPEQQQAYSNYRRALLDITEDPEFPWYNLVVSEVDYGFVTNDSLAPWPTLNV